MTLSRSLVGLALAALLIARSAAAAKSEPVGGASSAADAYQRLQKAAKGRDLPAMVAAFDEDNRALVLSTFLVSALSALSGQLEGVPAQPHAVEKLMAVTDELVKPAIEANPGDASVRKQVQSLTEEERAFFFIEYGISKLAVTQAVRLARSVEEAFAKVSHPAINALWDYFSGQVPKGPLKVIRQEGATVWAEADGRPVNFVRRGDRWFGTGVWFTATEAMVDSQASPPEQKKPKVFIGGKPIMTSDEPVPSGKKPTVFIGGKPVVTTSPAAAAELPHGHLLNGEQAYQKLRSEVRRSWPEARLNELQTGTHSLDGDGSSSGWFGQFLTSTPGELVTVGYMGGEVIPPTTGSILPGRKGIPDDELSFDTKRLYDIARTVAADQKINAQKITAGLLRNAGDGDPVWILHLWGANGRIAGTVIVDARTMQIRSKR